MVDITEKIKECKKKRLCRAGQRYLYNKTTNKTSLDVYGIFLTIFVCYDWDLLARFPNSFNCQSCNLYVIFLVLFQSSQLQTMYIRLYS